ncbi:MAG: hypothetical protein HZB50_14380 [Chloroflexi bacterium]|nr:hypothetical protein [Chloroflexota bacterium]
MIVQTIDSQQYVQQTRLIRSKVSAVLKKWGLMPRFKRWRLTQDPETRMIVLFGVLSNRYIATHTSIPFRDYFDPRVLHDLANELQLQVVSCNSNGPRYAFILDRGQLGKLPTHIDFPFVDDGKLMVRVVYAELPQSIPVPPVEVAIIDDQALVQQGVGAFLKVFDDIKLRDDAALHQPARELPKIVIIDREEFNKRIAEHEAERLKIKHIKSLLDQAVG